MLNKARRGLAAMCLLAVASLSACKDGALTAQGATFVNGAITVGQLFCSPGGQAAASEIVAVVNAADNKSVTVTGKAAPVVAASCPVVNGLRYVPVPPPPNPAAAPIVAVQNPPAA
jgi:hypothetical protein